MKFVRKSLPALVVGVLLVAGFGFGASSAFSRSAATGNPVDRAFAEEMIAHHQMAVQMAKIAQRRGRSAFVKQLADDIVRTQTREIATMRAADQRLRSAGVKKGSLGVPEHKMGMNGDVASLTTAKPFDRAFLRMMIPHHQGAIVMAKAELRKGKDPELRTLAQNIITAQQREIRQMRTQLKSTGASSMPEASMHGGH